MTTRHPHIYYYENFIFTLHKNNKYKYSNEQRRLMIIAYLHKVKNNYTILKLVRAQRYKGAGMVYQRHCAVIENAVRTLSFQ